MFPGNSMSFITIKIPDFLFLIGILLLIFLLFYIYFLGREHGGIDSIRDDLKDLKKLLEYDDLKKQNEELKRCIEIKNKK